jgi:hypothetical protein
VAINNKHDHTFTKSDFYHSLGVLTAAGRQISVRPTFGGGLNCQRERQNGPIWHVWAMVRPGVWTGLLMSDVVLLD